MCKYSENIQIVNCFKSQFDVKFKRLMEEKSKVKLRKTPFKWTDSLERKLISEWRERKDELRKAKRNSHIYTNISQCLGADLVSPEEVHVKIQNMTKRYRKEKTIIGPSGGKPSDWKHFEEINEMLGTFASHDTSLMDESFQMPEDIEHLDLAPSYTDESMTSANQMEAATSSPTIELLTPTPSTSGRRKRKKDEYLQLAILESESAKKDSEQMLGMMGKLINTLTDLTQQQKIFNEEFLRYLNNKKD